MNPTNKILSIKQVEATPDEPVSLTSVKEHIHVDFDDDDDYITDLITASRQAVEQYCNLSIVAKTIVLLADIHEETELPYGPVQEVTTVEYKSGANEYTELETDEYEIDGDPGDFARFSSQTCARMKIEYGAGYSSVPEDLKLAILNEIAFRYEYRGDEAQQYAAQKPGICEAARVLADKHVRLWL